MSEGELHPDLTAEQSDALLSHRARPRPFMAPPLETAEDPRVCVDELVDGGQP